MISSLTFRVIQMPSYFAILGVVFQPYFLFYIYIFSHKTQRRALELDYTNNCRAISNAFYKINISHAAEAVLTEPYLLCP